MYKIFHGFHLVEAYQDLKKARRLAKNQAVARCIKLTVAITISLILWLLPIDTFGIEGLTVIEQRLISIFIFATLMWVFEAVPAWTTSVLIVVLLLLTVSDSSLWFLTQGEFYQFNLSSCIRQQNSLTAQFVSFSLSNLANIFYPPQFLQ